LKISFFFSEKYNALTTLFYRKISLAMAVAVAVLEKLIYFLQQSTAMNILIFDY
jgi:hypothetical protein